MAGRALTPRGSREGGVWINLVNAMEYAREVGASIFGVGGAPGGTLARAHRSAVHAGPAQRLAGRQACGRRRGGFLPLYCPRPEGTRRAMAAAWASELAFDFEFGGAYASRYA